MFPEGESSLSNIFTGNKTSLGIVIGQQTRTYLMTGTGIKNGGIFFVGVIAVVAFRLEYQRRRERRGTDRNRLDLWNG